MLLFEGRAKQNNEVFWSTWRGCIPVAMPMSPVNKLGRGVFVELVQCWFCAVSGKMERNGHKLIVISLRFVIMSPALSLHLSKSLCRVRPLHSAIA